MNWLDRLEKKFGRFGIKGLMIYIIAFNAAVYLMSLAGPQGSQLVEKLMLIPQLVLNGEVWRLITFIFIPPSSSMIFILFVLYFYYMIGRTLEHEWGSFKFTAYYFIGVIGTIIGTFLAGGLAVGTSYYLNLSLFLAFAYIFPDYQILIFFILPVKMKYLAWLDAAYLAYSFLFGDTGIKLMIAASILNFLLFFGKDIILHLRSGRRAYYHRRSFASKIPRDMIIHRCEVCGRSEKDDRNLEFRYCVDCDGDHEYCMEHLNSHKHVKNLN